MRRVLASLVLVALLCACLVSLAEGKGNIDPHKVRHELRDILSAREYDHSQSAVDRFFTRIGKAVSDAWSSVGRWLLSHLTLSGSTFGEIIATIGSWLAVAGFLVLGFFVARKLIRMAGGRGAREADDGEAPTDIPSARPLMKQASRLAESGDFRSAFRAVYLACIAYLDDIKALRFERSRTNWEYLRELRQGGHERPYGEMHPLTLDFDRKIYGREICTSDDYSKAAATYDRLSAGEAK